MMDNPDNSHSDEQLNLQPHPGAICYDICSGLVNEALRQCSALFLQKTVNTVNDLLLKDDKAWPQVLKTYFESMGKRKLNGILQGKLLSHILVDYLKGCWRERNSVAPSARFYVLSHVTDENCQTGDCEYCQRENCERSWIDV